MKEQGFDTEAYVSIQSQTILERVSKFGEKLYLEFGGKLTNDFHAARVLPGYDPNAKIRVLLNLKDESEIYYCVSAKDIERGRVRHDFGLTYDQQVFKDISFLAEHGLSISGIVITRFEGESLAQRFIYKLNRMGIPSYIHHEIKDYPFELDEIVSQNGYGRQPSLPTKKPIVIVTGAGGGSGKMSVCLSQIYHESSRGISAGFAKFETFPIWNLPIDHPVNIAYEAATADLGDVNMVDPFHLQTYQSVAINYNRDVENFALLKQIFSRISDQSNPVNQYSSPTDMGVNMVAAGITKDQIVREAGKQEIIRRYFRYRLEYKEGIETKETVEKVERLMQKAGLAITDRKTVTPAREDAKSAKLNNKGNEGVYCGAAIELPNGSIVTGKNSPLLHAESAVVLNAIKALSGIDKNTFLLPPQHIKSVITLKEAICGSTSVSLNLEETLIVLGFSAAVNPVAETCLGNLKQLAGCEMHITHIPSHGDYEGIRKLRLNFTTDGEIPMANSED
jgi:uncharacterized protein (UPF0371 family)